MLDFEGKNAFLIIFSIITVLATFYLLYVAVDMTLASNVKLIEKERDISDAANEDERETTDVKPQKTNSKKKAKRA